MKTFYSFIGGSMLIFALLFSIQVQAQFTPGKLVVTRIGNGNTLTSAAFPVGLVQYNTTGTAQTGTVIVTMPTVASILVGASRALTQSGTASSEGDLSLSTDGRYLVLVGYNANVAKASVSSGSDEAVIGRVDAAGTVNTLTSLTRTKAYPGGSIRSACSVDGSAFWTAGAGNSTTGSIRYAIFNNTNDSGKQISKTVSSARVVNIFNGQVYSTASSGSFRLASVGVGTPVTTGQVMTNLPGFPTASYDPYAYVFLDQNATVPGVDVLYVANQGTASTGGLYKYSLVNNIWVANGYIAGNIRGVTGTVNCDGKAELYMTRSLNSSAKASRLHAYTDLTGYNVTLGNGAININSTTLLATAATNYAFGGVSFSPLTSARKPDMSSFSITANSVCKGSGTVIALNGSTLENGTYTIDYSLSGANTGNNLLSTVTVYNGLATISLPASLLVNGGATTVSINSITNSLGCSTNSTATTSLFVSDLLVEASADSISCYGGTTNLNITASGGVEPYSGTGSFSVPAGPYSYTVFDATGCSAIVSGNIGQPDSLIVSGSSINVLCNGGNTGTITVTASGGTPGYLYSSDGGATFGSNNILNNLIAGTYQVVVKDANGCTKTIVPSFVITQPTALTGQYCYNPTAPNAKVLGARGKGGTPPYTYSSNGTTYLPGNALGGTAYAFKNRNPGSYTIYIKDSKNCVFVKTVNTATLPVCPLGAFPVTSASKEVNAAVNNEGTLTVKVFPNPSAIAFTAVIQGGNNAPVRLRVIDVNGKTVHSATIRTSQVYSFGEKLLPGMYLLEIIQGDERKMISVLKQ